MRDLLSFRPLFLASVFLISISHEAIARPQPTVVTNSSDFALREAIAKGSTVTFAFDGIIGLTNVIVVTHDVSVDGGTNKVTIDGGGNSQIFRVAPGVKLVLQNLSIANGHMEGATNGFFGGPGQGGAIFNEGTIAATQCVFSNNAAVGGDGDPISDVYPGLGYGGAIFSTGDLLLTNSMFFGNGSIGGTNIHNPFQSIYGESAFGGALYIKSGNGFITDCAFTTNVVQVGHAMLGKGNMAEGGGIFIEDGNLRLDHCLFNGNLVTGGIGRAGGGNGLGGALYLDAGQVEIIQSQFETNMAVGGYSFPSLVAGKGGLGSGGGIYVDSATVLIEQTSILANIAQGGDDYNYLEVLPAGAAGGGIFNANGEVAVVNSTIAQNQTIGGANTLYEVPSLSGDANGAGIYNAGHFTIAFSTVAENANNFGIGGTNGNKVGDGIYNTGQVTLENSIVANHPNGNFRGTIINGGHNISSDSSGHFSSSLENTDPKLGPISDNGGPTLTMDLLDGSPAIDAGSTNGPIIDQRGNSRPFGAGFDIGAVERSPVQNIVLQIEAVGGKFRISFSGRSNVEYDLIKSTDLSTWSKAATQTTDQTGHASFTVDPFADYEFFRVTETAIAPAAK